MHPAFTVSPRHRARSSSAQVPVASSRVVYESGLIIGTGVS